MERILKGTPDWVSYVPIDVKTQTLDEVLTKAGSTKNQKIFMYGRA
ncbi:MAG: hypothetical protein WBB19_02665 [Desulforhopalus sp.]